MKVADLVWSAVAQPKHRFIGWLATLGKMLTKDRMIGMSIQVDNVNCILCNGDAMETQEHLFVQCEWTRAVKQELSRWTRHDEQTTRVRQMLEQIKNKHWKQFRKEVIAAVHLARIYYTWRARNTKIFQGRTVKIDEIVVQIKREVKERIDLLHMSKKAQKCREFIRQLTCN
ncbi:PREDICTED: uncharacterized protein LOC109216132 [Nicotiana attenuata]|uniref:uncharacterized protein LOC109216132 n=1 Tax=Nicotiana attenuata TaxID=49451 RepID=UPI0009054BF5|nr:PREDICTED: uncharacterized protein LOC109216132 [Nicotiana attenuata]